ncbi:ABC-2 family transporter [Motilibacter peucedani]|uniref:ABC-2 family transporter n=1 Tax=Motilibacter peucedani TaxID=598650 RepID=A0A420XRN1_9ACTN|nr:ABC transporter permease subunit [Motilibacter peucedani]RKS77538.1 ABC-2 family transporter [Motilibacter peucedani]
MTATAAPAPRTQPPASGARFPNVVRAEWTKVVSLRSTWWTLLATFVVTVGLTTLISWAIVSNWADRGSDFEPAGASMSGLLFGQLAITVLGVLSLASEYSTGGIRTTFVAVPRRLSVLAAKALVVAGLCLVAGLVTCFTAFFIGQAFFASKDGSVGLGDPGVLRAVVGGGLYVAGCGLFGLAVASVLRHSAGSITAVVALLFVLPLLANAIPGSVGDAVTKYFTSNAGQHITDARTVADDVLSPWAGYAVFTLEWLVVLVIGAFLLTRRDA